MKTPDIIYKNLFHDLHLSGIWPDGKLLSDAIPLFSPDDILKKYEAEKAASDFNLKAFFNQNFKIKDLTESDFKSDLTRSPEEHIQALWSVLQREPDKKIEGSSLIPLPYPYIVPGGRFNEVYYWDSYFTMLGLKIHNQKEIIENIIKNFAWQIDQLGFIPNGNRTYFCGRSQPPFFSLMVELLDSISEESVLKKYLPALEKEYFHWMDGRQESLDNYNSYKKIIKLPEGFLNRYQDIFPNPRAEMYRDDVLLQQKSGRNAENLYLSLRAACESGWDFSSRWFKDGDDLEFTFASDIIPVDLNCLLYNLEQLIFKVYKKINNIKKAEWYEHQSLKRKELIQKYCWNEEAGFYFDYDFIKKEQRTSWHLGGLYPLFFNISTKKQAEKCTENVSWKFIKSGGAVTTLNHSGQQWDAPNGWAPLQWMTVKGLDNYGYKDLATDIAQRWTTLNENVYYKTGKFVEKYNVQDTSLEAGGGEYPVQDGFGWSNGVYLALREYLTLNK